MSYHHGIGALATEQQLAAAPKAIPLVFGTQYTATPAATAAPTSGVSKMLVVGGLAVAGFLVYRHFKHKRTP